MRGVLITVLAPSSGNAASSRIASTYLPQTKSLRSRGARRARARAYSQQHDAQRGKLSLRRAEPVPSRLAQVADGLVHH